MSVSLDNQLLALDAIIGYLRAYRLPTREQAIVLCDQIGPVRDLLAERLVDQKRIQLEERAVRERRRRRDLADVQFEAQKRR